jgi:hypothetical protein
VPGFFEGCCKEDPGGAEPSRATSGGDPLAESRGQEERGRSVGSVTWLYEVAGKGVLSRG